MRALVVLLYRDALDLSRRTSWHSSESGEGPELTSSRYTGSCRFCVPSSTDLVQTYSSSKGSESAVELPSAFASLFVFDSFNSLFFFVGVFVDS
jgi:hypothetical protein